VEPKFISVTGARQHNLQDVDVDMPRDKLVVITGTEWLRQEQPGV
jgi:excinuclease ABC subunit A